MGIDNRRLYGLAMALVARHRRGGRRVPGRPHDVPRSSSGPDRPLFAFEAVIIGGLGSLWGTLVGGAVLGIAQTVGAKLSPGWGILNRASRGVPGRAASRARTGLLHPGARRSGILSPPHGAQRPCPGSSATHAGPAASGRSGRRAQSWSGLRRPCPAWGDPSTMRILVEFIALLVLAQMWNLLAGYAGLVSIGQQAYVGLGGYALIVLADDLGVNPFVAVPLAGVVAAAFALPTAALVFRFHGGYFAVGTWAIAEVYRLLIANTPALGRGSGRTLKARLPARPREPGADDLFAGAGHRRGRARGAVYAFLRSRYGLGLMAIRDSEHGSDTLGVDVFRIKLVVYVGVAFGTGVTGALIHLNLLRISPDAAFSINWTAYVIFIVVIGGLGSVEGPILGTLVFFPLRRATLRLRGVVRDPTRHAGGGGDARAPAGALGHGGRAVGPAVLSGGTTGAGMSGTPHPGPLPRGGEGGRNLILPLGRGPGRGGEGSAGLPESSS